MKNFIPPILFYIFLAHFAHASLVVPPGIPVTSSSSLSDKQAKTKQFIKEESTMGFNVLKASVISNFNQIWKNTLKLTPQQAMDGLGADACAAHMLLLSVGQILNAASPGSFTLSEPCPVSCNQDGTATIGSCPSPSPSGD